MKKILKMLFNRVVLVGLAILVQVLLLILMVVKFQEYFVYFLRHVHGVEHGGGSHHRQWQQQSGI